MSAPVKVVALLTVRPGREADLTSLLLAMAPLCRAEAGNLQWEVWRDQAQPDRYVLDETYSDDAAVAAHRETAHYQDYRQRIGELAERTVLMLNPVAGEPAGSGTRSRV
jgi:quinol monooxygenase YgiN